MCLSGAVDFGKTEMERSRINLLPGAKGHQAQISKHEV